jgi:hypothetical protein
LSKLNKFKEGINADQAAELLSRLIDEDVSSKDIWDLFWSGHLDGYVKCNATIVRTEPLLDDESHQGQVEQGRYIMTPKDDVEFCWALHVPCMTIQLDRIPEVTALSDRENNLYVLRDNETGEYLNLIDDSSTLDSQLFEPADIYALADKANDSKPAIATAVIRRNKWCPLGGEYFNYPYEESVPRHLSLSRPIASEPPSRLLALAAVLEVALGERKKHNQSSLISSILDRHEGVRGLSESGMQKVFAEANAALQNAKQ